MERAVIIEDVDMDRGATIEYSTRSHSRPPRAKSPFTAGLAVALAGALRYNTQLATKTGLRSII